MLSISEILDNYKDTIKLMYNISKASFVSLFILLNFPDRTMALISVSNLPIR